jgi:exopolysaccharide biosynthesis polyprenyl glycosylphosphotransferase
MSAIDEVAPSLTFPSLGSLTATRRIAPVAPRASAAVASRQQWERRFRARLHVTDTVIVLLACALASVVSLLTAAPSALVADPWVFIRVPLLTAGLWVLALGLLNTRDAAILGSGAKEYTRVAHATGFAFGTLAALYVLFEWAGTREVLFWAMPAGGVALIVTRWLSRRWLVRQRAQGRYCSRTIVVGSRDDVEYAIRTLGGDGKLGYTVVGTAVLDDDTDSLRIDGQSYAVVRGADAVPRAATGLRADTIIVAGQPVGDPSYIKRLAWELEGTAAELVLSSRIADVAGPRMSLRPVEGMPLIHVRIPSFEGGAHLVKRALDIVVSGIALLFFAPIAFVIAMAIKVDDPGPAFFHQERVGRDGRTFKMVKFRSMRVNAEAELAKLLEANEGAGPLFKMKDDPRVTRIGAFLRKFSIDEVPQFWNVLRGDMSVVGPRPPLPSEVTAYDGTVFRRLYIKPGITGPWQVGGRSDLSWEESVRLDLRYVENWSVLSDIVLMWRTAKVMIKPEGAY